MLGWRWCRSWCGITATAAATATALLPAQYRKGWHTKGDRRPAKIETGVRKKKAVCVAKTFVYFLPGVRCKGTELYSIQKMFKDVEVTTQVAEGAEQGSVPFRQADAQQLPSWQRLWRTVKIIREEARHINRHGAPLDLGDQRGDVWNVPSKGS